MLEAMQLADPSMHLPRREAVWNAAKLLCDHVGINFDKFQQQTQQFHLDYEEMSRVDQKNCTRNLLRFYNTLAADKRPELVNKPEVMEYAVAV